MTTFEKPDHIAEDVWAELKPLQKEWEVTKDQYKVGDTFRGVEIKEFNELGYPVGVNHRDLVRGYMTKGNKCGRGRPKGSRDKLTQEMLDAVAVHPIKPHEFLLMTLGNPNWSPSDQIKAAMKLTDIVYPKAASVEMEVTDKTETDISAIDDRINELMGKVKIETATKLVLDDTEGD